MKETLETFARGEDVLTQPYKSPRELWESFEKKLGVKFFKPAPTIKSIRESIYSIFRWFIK